MKEKVLSNLTDLEICKRIAEIEGKDFYLLESGGDTYPLIKVWQDSVLKDKCVPKRFFEARDYNPLADDALCFKLIVKYKVEICYDDKDVSIYEDGDRKYIAISTKSFTDKPNKAICLAIIEAHK